MLNISFYLVIQQMNYCDNDDKNIYIFYIFIYVCLIKGMKIVVKNPN